MATLMESCSGTFQGYQNIYGTVYQYQTFTPTYAHTITSVKLMLKRYGLPGTLTVSIKATDEDGKPTGADLCSGNTDGDSINGVTSEQIEITFSSGYALSAATMYVICTKAPSGSWGNHIGWDNVYNLYSGGHYLYSNDSGSTFTINSNLDLKFEEWGTDIAYTHSLTTSIGLSPTLSRTTTHGRSLTTSAGLRAVIYGTQDLGEWLCVGSNGSGSIKTKDGSTWTVCAQDSAGRGTLPAAWLAQFENRLCTLNYNNSGFAYSEVNSLTADWTDKLYLPNLAQDFKGLFVGRDASDNPTLYFLTTKGMYYLDVFTNFVFGPTEAAWEDDSTSGKKGIYWKGDNYVAVGKGLLKISGGVATPIGPDMDDGLPENLQGTITDMLGVGFWLVIAIDGGASKKSCILKRYITGNHWHPVYVGSVNTSITALCWDNGTLYFGEGTNVKSLPMPNVMSNAKYLTGDRIASGDIIYPKFFSEFTAMPKTAHKVRAVTQDCNSNDKITIYYRIDENTDWTSLGEFTTSPRPTALSFPAAGDAVGVTFESIQLKAHYARGSTTTSSPKIESLTLEYRVTPPVLWGFDFNVLALTQDDVNGQDIIDALRTAMDTGTLLSFYPTGDKGDTEYLVEFTAMPSSEKGTEFGQEGIFQVSVQEVID